MAASALSHRPFPPCPPDDIITWFFSTLVTSLYRESSTAPYVPWPSFGLACPFLPLFIDIAPASAGHAGCPVSNPGPCLGMHDAISFNDLRRLLIVGCPCCVPCFIFIRSIWTSQHYDAAFLLESPIRRPVECVKLVSVSLVRTAAGPPPPLYPPGNAELSVPVFELRFANSASFNKKVSNALPTVFRGVFSGALSPTT